MGYDPNYEINTKQMPITTDIEQKTAYQTKPAQSKVGKIYHAFTESVPEWFLISSVIVGAITIALILLKINPLLSPIKKGVLWLLDLWENFLKKDEKDIGKTETPKD